MTAWGSIFLFHFLNVTSPDTANSALVSVLGLLSLQSCWEIPLDAYPSVGIVGHEMLAYLTSLHLYSPEGLGHSG